MVTFFLTSSFIITAVLAARSLLKNKVSSLVLYPLWLIVLLRLFIPVNLFESRFSIMNIVSTLSIMEKNTVPIQNVSDKAITENNTEKPQSMDVYQQSQFNKTKKKQENQNPEKKTDTQNTEIYNTNMEQQKTSVSSHIDNTTNLNKALYDPIIQCALMIWISGSLLFFIFVIVSNGIFYKKLYNNRKPVFDHYFEQGYYKNIAVYTADIVTTPCLAGIVHPAIYLPSRQLKDSTEKYLEQVLTHEYTHYKHKDHIWSILRVLCLAIYWFHPFVWLAAYYSKQDAELACDETVLRGCTDEDRYHYGKMLLNISQNENKNKFCIAASLKNHESNLKERIIMITKKRSIQRIHIAWIALFSIVLAGCGLTDETSAVSTTLPQNQAPAVADHPADNQSPENISANDKDKENKLIVPAIHPSEDERVRAFATFMKKDIKNRPELSKWNNPTNQLYFSVQYTTDQIPCLFVTDHVFSNYSNYAYLYYYDTNEKEIKLLTYMSTSGSGDDIETIYGKFVTTTHHSYRVYDWNHDNNNRLTAEEIYGYYMTIDDSGKQSEIFTRTTYEWNVPLKNTKGKIDSVKAHEFLGSQNKVDQCASDTKTTEQYPVKEALEFSNRYAGAAPVMFYKNTPKKWKQFYKDGHMNSVGYKSMQGDFKNKVQKNIEKMTDYDYIQAEKEQSILVHDASLHYLGEISDHQSLFYVYADYNQRAFVIRTGLKYEIYLLNSPKKQNKKSSSYSDHTLLQIKHSEFYTDDYDHDQEMETAFYLIENPDTDYESKKTYIIDYHYTNYETSGIESTFVYNLYQAENNNIIHKS